MKQCARALSLSFLTIALCLGFLPEQAASQSSPTGYTIEGTVYDAVGGSTVSSATVYLIVDGSSEGSTTTDGNGDFSFSEIDLSGGSEIITVHLNADGNDGGSVTQSASGDIYEFDIYQNTFTVWNVGGGGEVTDTELTTNGTLDGLLTLSTNDTVNTTLLYVPTGGTYSQENGTLTAHDIDIDGSINANNGLTCTGSFDDGGSFYGALTMNASGAETFTSQGYYLDGLEFTGGGSWTISSAINLQSGNLTITNGAVAFGNNNITIPGSSNFTVAVNGSFTMGNNITTMEGGTISTNGSSLNNLTIGTSSTVTAGSDLDINGNMVIPASGTFDLNGKTINIAGNYTNDGTFTHSNGTVVFDGTGSKTVDTNDDSSYFSEYGSTMPFYNVTFDNASGTWTLTNNGLGVANDLTISNGTLAAGSQDIIVSGDWINNGTFTQGTRTVYFDGTNQTIGGTVGTTFYNLIKEVTSADTLTFANAITTTISNNTTLKGASGQNLSLRSDSSGTQFEIDVSNSGTRDIDYVDVKDSNNTNATSVDPTNCVNSGNINNWCGQPAAGAGDSISGTAYSDQGVTALTSATIAIAVNGSADSTTTSHASNGTFTLSDVDTSAGDVLTLYVDGNAVDGVTVTVTDGGDLTGINIYGDRLIVRHDNAGALTNTHLDTANNVSDADIDAIYTVSSTVPTVLAGKELLVWTGDSFTPGGAVNTHDLEIQSSATMTMATNALGISGTLSNAGTLSVSSGQTTTFSSTSSETVTSGGATLQGVTFHGSGGSWTLSDNIDINAALTITAGTLSASSRTITLAGNFTNNGTFTAGTSTLTMDGGSQTIAGSSATTFNNFSKAVTSAATLTFPTGVTTTISGNATLTGQSSNLLSLRSSSSGTQSSVNISNTSRSISYVDVQDQNNTNATAIDCTSSNCTNSNNNTNWTFTAAGNYIDTKPSVNHSFVLASDNSTDVAASENGQSGTVKTRARKSGAPVVDVNIDYSGGDVDLSALVADTSGYKSVVDVTAVSEISGTHDVYVLKGSTAYVRVCPEATTLEEVNSSCTNGVTGYVGDTLENVGNNNDTVVISQVSIDGTVYYKLAGLTGSGGQGEGGAVPEFSTWALLVLLLGCGYYLSREGWLKDLAMQDA